MPSRSRPGHPLSAVTALAVASLMVLAGCGATSTAPAPKPAPAPKSATGTTKAAAPAAPAPTRVTLRLPWLSSGPDAPFYYAVAKGWYKAAGIDLTIRPGTSSLLSAESIASGKDTFGFADATAVAGVVSEGGKEKDIAQIIDTSPVGVIHRPNVSLASPRDLEGKTILTNSSGGPVMAMLHAVTDAGHVPFSALHLNIVAASAEASSFAAHPVDMLTGFCNSTYPAAKSLVPSSVCTTVTQIAPSVQALSYGVITSDHEIQTHPGLVRRFVTVSIRAWKFAVGHESQMLPLSLKTAQALKQLPPKAATWKVGWAATLAGLNQPKGKPFGYSTKSAWTTTLQVLKKYAGLKKVLPLSDYYTNTFLAAASAKPAGGGSSY